MPQDRYDGPVPPETIVQSREPLKWGVLVDWRGDPGADMILAIRNIEFYAERQTELLEYILKALRMQLDAKSTSEDKGIQGRPRTAKE